MVRKPVRAVPRSLLILVLSLFAGACEQIKSGDLTSLQNFVEGATSGAAEQATCPEGPTEARQRCLERRYQEAQSTYDRARPNLDQRLADAEEDPLGFVEGLNRIPLRDLIRPINARLDAFQARLDLLRLSQETAGAGSEGVVFALNPCYVERGDVADVGTGECRFLGETFPPKPLQMVAAVPLGVNGEPILNYVGGRKNLLEFITFDPNKPEDEDLYLFGDPRFNELYLSAVANRLDTAADLMTGLTSTSALGAAVFAMDCELGLDTTNRTDEEDFICSFGKLLQEASEGGGALVEKVASAFLG